MAMATAKVQGSELAPGKQIQTKSEPILYSTCRQYPPPKPFQGDIDTSNACVIEVDGFTMKRDESDEYWGLVTLLRRCLLKRNVYRFNHIDEDPEADGTPSCYEDQVTFEKEHFDVNLSIAIKNYNSRTKNSKLEDERLIRVNSSLGCFHYQSMTFTAIDMDTGERGTYQAAIAESFSDPPEEIYLAFLRHVEADKVLAILSITGAEEDMRLPMG